MITHRKILGIKYIYQERKLEVITFLTDIKNTMNRLSDRNNKQTDSFSFLFLPASPFTLFTDFSRKSIRFIFCFWQKFHSFYSLFLAESPFTLFSVSGRKSIHTIHCFCQKVYSFYSLFLPEIESKMNELSSRNRKLKNSI